MTATRLLMFSTAAAVAASTGISVFAAGGTAAPGVRLKSITSRVHAKGASLVIEATEPVPYVATRPDALTLLLDLRNVVSDGLANNAARAGGPIAGVALEATDSMGAPSSRVRVSLTQAVAYQVRSERNTIVVRLCCPWGCSSNPHRRRRQRLRLPRRIRRRSSRAKPAPGISRTRISSACFGSSRTSVVSTW